MKSKTRNLIKVIVFLLIGFLILNILYAVFRWKDTNGDYMSSFEALASLEDNTVDVLFVGPSYTFTTMNPAVFWEDYGLATFNMSISGQDKNSTVGCVKEVLKTQKPKVVMIDAAGSLFDKHEVQGNLYRNTIAMDLSLNDLEVISKSVDLKDRLNYILRWPIVHTRYKELQRYDFEQYMPSIYTMGYVYEYQMQERPYIPDIYIYDEVFDISETNKAWVDDLSALAEANGFSLAFYLTAGAADGPLQKTINGLALYLEEKGIPFVDYNKSPLVEELNYSTDFSDYRHMNAYGSQKLAKYIEAFLIENYDLTSHYGEAGYEPWGRALTYKNHIVASQAISANPDMHNIMAYVGALDSLVMVVATEGEYKASALDLQAACLAFGLTEEDYEKGGTWVIEDHEKIAELSEAGEYVKKVNSAENLVISKITGANDCFVTNASVGTLYYRNTDQNANGVYLFVYDKVTDKVICNLSFQ